MTAIAALGPERTFSHQAAQRYASRLGETPDIRLLPTIRKTFEAVGPDCPLAILPIENMVEGYVQPVLDLLLHGHLTIVDELLLPVGFAFVSRAARLADVRRVHVQFVSQGQCSDFLDTLTGVEIRTVESNGVALQSAVSGTAEDGAIVPAHTLDETAFPLVIPQVANQENNQTRFIIIAATPQPARPDLPYKTSLAILEGVDRPGMLSQMLDAFARRAINLVSIMSRPTKEHMGRYHFFVDIEGHAESPAIRAALDEIRLENELKLLGSYPRATTPALPPARHRNLSHPATDFFAHDPTRPRVVVTAGEGPYANTRKALATLDLSRLRGKRVLLKPNVGRVAAAESGIVTHPEVVAAAIDAFQTAGAEVSIGESPITGVKTLEAFEACSLGAVARKRGVRLIDMDQRPPVEVPIPGGLAIQMLKVCADVFEHDVVVSIPVMKMHMHTGVTLGVKNMKGCLWRRSKVRLHMLPALEGNPDKSLDIAIADMATVLRPHLTLIDGTVGMEGLGPSAGAAKPFGVVVLGIDPFATDAVACRLMGTRAEAIPHLRLGAARGAGLINLEQIAVTPADWQDLADPFAPPPANLSITYPNVTILDKNSCSACQSTVLMFLQRHHRELFDYFPPGTQPVIAIGSGHADVPEKTLCIGNCTLAHKNRGLFIGGCPPVASTILRALGRHNDPTADEDREY